MAATDVADNNVFEGEYEVIMRTVGASGTMVGTGTFKSVPAAEGTATYKDDILASTAIDTTVARSSASPQRGRSPARATACASTSCAWRSRNLSLLDDVLDRLKALPPDERQSVIDTAMEQTKAMRFVPLPGPQTQAYLSKADVLLYGGQAGGGKSPIC
jgi:hypothetical protein